LRRELRASQTKILEIRTMGEPCWPKKREVTYLQGKPAYGVRFGEGARAKGLGKKASRKKKTFQEPGGKGIERKRPRNQTATNPAAVKR